MIAPYFQQINTMGLRAELIALCKKYGTQEVINELESVSKAHRKKNSVRINHLQMGRKVKVDDDRPDLQGMKL